MSQNLKIFRGKDQLYFNFNETLEETYQVQRCFTGKDRVCDTTYKIDTTTKDDYQCCNVETPNCFMEEKVINDVTCTNTVEFNCKREKTTKNDGYGQKEVVCTRTPKQDCYNIPRKVILYFLF